MRPPVGRRVPLLQGPVFIREGPEPRVDRAPRADRGQRLGVGSGEAQALPGECVQARRLYPTVTVGADVVLPQAVYDDQDDVHLRRSGASPPPIRAAPAIPAPATFRKCRLVESSSPHPSPGRIQGAIIFINRPPGHAETRSRATMPAVGTIVTGSRDLSRTAEGLWWMAPGPRATAGLLRVLQAPEHPEHPCWW